MTITGRCYCGDLRYEAEGEPVFRIACHCRECQYISGGGANHVLGLPSATFRYTHGAPKSFTRPDLETPATREFCGVCGTHMLTRIPANPAVVIVKVGTLDDSSVYPGPQVAIWMHDRQPYHLVAEGVTTFDGFPG